MWSWISVRGPYGSRFGQSWGPEDRAPPKLPSWRRYEVRQTLINAAAKKGEAMSKERADYIIDKTLAIADFDTKGGMTLHLRGERDALINQLCEVLVLWGMPMSTEEAARMVDKAIARRSRPWFWFGAAIGTALFIIALASYASASPCGCRCLTSIT